MNEIEKLPTKSKEQLLDFIEFLKAKERKQVTEFTNLAESSFSDDWLSKEEEEAWQHL